MMTFLLNLLGSFMLFYGLFSYISGVGRAFLIKRTYVNSSAITSVFLAAIGLTIILSI